MAESERGAEVMVLQKEVNDNCHANRAQGDSSLLTAEQQQILKRQDSRLVTPFKAQKLEAEAKRNWDLFYKRNETRFFKDRHWTTREFQELVGGDLTSERKILLEIGCGVGNFVFPLLEERLNLFVQACDFSPRAIDFVCSHPLYDETRIRGFQCDLTCDDLGVLMDGVQADITSLIFVLSAIHPEKFSQCLRNVWNATKPGGMVILRDYGRYDMAQLRFGPGSKIDDNFYVRQDGTRVYYFTTEELASLFTEAGFVVHTLGYVHRRTVNIKENVDVPRTFVQGKFQKPVNEDT